MIFRLSIATSLALPCVYSHRPTRVAYAEATTPPALAVTACPIAACFLTAAALVAAVIRHAPTPTPSAPSTHFPTWVFVLHRSRLGAGLYDLFPPTILPVCFE
jgi:hypothetical protein